MIAAVYSDGGVSHSNPSPYGGAYAWRHVDRHDRKLDFYVACVPAPPGGTVTNNVMEFLGLLTGLEALPDGWAGEACSDSQITLGRFFENWRCEGIPLSWITRLAVLHERLNWKDVQPIGCKGHPTHYEIRDGMTANGARASVHLLYCDEACTRAMKALWG